MTGARDGEKSIKSRRDTAAAGPPGRWPLPSPLTAAPAQRGLPPDVTAARARPSNVSRRAGEAGVRQALQDARRGKGRRQPREVAPTPRTTPGRRAVGRSRPRPQGYTKRAAPRPGPAAQPCDQRGGPLGRAELVPPPAPPQTRRASLPRHPPGKGTEVARARPASSPAWLRTHRHPSAGPVVGPATRLPRAAPLPAAAAESCAVPNNAVRTIYPSAGRPRREGEGAAGARSSPQAPGAGRGG